MTQSSKWEILIIVHVFVAGIVGLMFQVWPLEKAATLCAVVGPAWIASFLIWNIAIGGKNALYIESCADNPRTVDISEALKGEFKIRSLLSLASRAHAETVRYREHVWKVVVWTLSLLGATLLASQQSTILAKISCFKVICVFFAVFVTAFGLRDVFFDYYWFVGNRNLQRECERLLKFCEKDAYQHNKSLLPERYKTENYTLWDCVGHLIQWLFIIYAAGVFIILAIL